jgi:hypothetical protein
MLNLRKDICGIQDSSRLNSDVGDLPSRIMTHIPSHIQYACRHWAFHLENGMISDGLLDLLKKFCSEYLLHWVEVCSLLGELRDALLALDVAQRTLAVRDFIHPLYLQKHSFDHKENIQGYHQFHGLQVVVWLRAIYARVLLGPECLLSSGIPLSATVHTEKNTTF